MQFEIGDQVVHPFYGVGIVKTLTAQQFGGAATREYYEVAADGITVWVPIDEQGLTVLRGIDSKHLLAECRQLLSSDPVVLERNPHMRQLEIATRLKGGLLPALCEMVRDLRARSSQAPLGQTEDRVLRRIFKVLCGEWAAAAGLSAQAAEREIENLLREGRQSQMPKAGI